MRKNISSDAHILHRNAILWYDFRVSNDRVEFDSEKSMPPLFETITDLADGADILRERRYGIIEMKGGVFRRIRLRPFPKIVTAPGILLFGNTFHRHFPGDRLWLYYNQPVRFSNFLVLKYVVSQRNTGFGSLARALDVLDEIARLKRSDALLCDVGNWRIATEMIGRWGWVPHTPRRWHRHFIKRFYGEFPPRAKWLEK
jgi:hypothetical protein